MAREGFEGRFARRSSANTLLLARFATTIGKKGSGEPEMFYENFAYMIKTYPMIAFPMFRLQEKMRRAFLGEKFWLNQRALFVEARKRLQVRRK